MRIYIFSALTAASFGLLASAPAEATSFWTCMGPEVACGSAGSPLGSTYNYRSPARVYAGEPRRRVSAYRAQPRHVAERAEPRRAVRVAAVSPRNEEPRLATDASTSATQAAPQAAPGGASAERTAAVKAAVKSAQSGMASYYGTESGTHTASGTRFNPGAMTAAHRSLPFGTKVRVTNKSNGSSVIVTINDRGPFVRGRIIDLSTGAAGVIGMKGAGVAPVTLEVVGG